MTPHSTDRANQMSPLEIFGAMAHTSAPGAEPSPAFEAVLNKATSPTKAELHRPPVRQDAAERPERDTDIREEYASKKVSAPTRKKQPAKTGPVNRPQRKDDDREPRDEPSADQIGGRPATDSCQSSPPSEDVPEDQGAVPEEGTQPVDPASEQVLDDNAAAAPPLVTLVGELPGVVIRPGASIEPSESDDSQRSAATAPSTENSVAVNKPTVQQNEPVAFGDAALSPREYAAAVRDNVTLTLAEPEQDSVHMADPIAAIDQQTAAAGVEIQPVELGGNHKNNESGESDASDSRRQNAVDPPEQVAPSPDSLTNQQTQSAAAPPPAETAASLPKEAPAPQSDNSQQTAGVQSSPNRLPQHVLTRAEGHRIHNPAPVPVDSARFLSRVAKAFLSAQQREGNEVRLRLSPPELGSLRLQVSVQDGVMVARMETETEAARSSLVNNLPALRERLAEQGIRVERFDIDLMQRPSTGTPDRPSDPQQQNEPQPLRPLRAQQAISDAPARITLSTNWNGQGRLNVII